MDSATAPLLIVFRTHGIHSLRWHRPITWSPSLSSSKSFKLIIPSWEACRGLTPFPSTTARLFNSQLPPVWRSEELHHPGPGEVSHHFTWTTTCKGDSRARLKEGSFFTVYFQWETSSHLTKVPPKKQYFRTTPNASIDFYFYIIWL